MIVDMLRLLLSIISLLIGGVTLALLSSGFFPGETQATVAALFCAVTVLVVPYYLTTHHWRSR
jgi:hypothetical protein